MLYLTRSVQNGFELVRFFKFCCCFFFVKLSSLRASKYTHRKYEYSKLYFVLALSLSLSCYFELFSRLCIAQKKKTTNKHVLLNSSELKIKRRFKSYWESHIFLVVVVVVIIILFQFDWNHFVFVFVSPANLITAINQIESNFDYGSYEIIIDLLLFWVIFCFHFRLFINVA